jgi:hypothetical protein
MPTTMLTNTSSKLERVHAESKVIRANLQHLAMRLADENPQLRENLQPSIDRFDAYLFCLSQACAREEELSAV